MKRNGICMLLLCLGMIFFALGMGSSDLSYGDVLEILSHKVFHTETTAKSGEITILWNIRLPRILLSFLVGGALAVSGAIAQSILQNPLASPYTLGVSSGASFGASLVILAGLTLPLYPQFSQLSFAFLFALGTIALVMGLSFQVDKSLSNITVVLTGMVVSLFFSGLQSVLTSIYATEAGKITLWAMGSFAMRGWDYVKLLFPFVLVGVFFALCLSRELDLCCFGEMQAQAMGVNSQKVKGLAFFTMSLLTGASIAITGTIGFVDLIAPHVARRWVGNRHIALLPCSFVVGGLLMTATDTVARTILSPTELPVGSVTALLGAPFFFYVYRGKGGKSC